MMIISVLICVVFLPILGKYIDQSPAIKIVPYAFMTRCLFVYLFSMVQSPDSFFSYVVCILIIIATVIESNLLDTVFSKIVGAQTRGIFFSL